jgi:predicted NBD/HSP70 family sugar kinase
VSTVSEERAGTVLPVDQGATEGTSGGHKTVRAAPAQEDIRRVNLGAVLRHVHFSGPVSRADLTTRLGLNRSTIGDLTTDLAEAGLITEAAPKGASRAGRAGRPSIVVRPESERFHVLAVAIGVDRITVARVGLGGAVLDRRETGTSRDAFGVSEVVETVRGFAESVLATSPKGSVHLGTGAAFCGMVRAVDGVVRFGPNIGWHEVPLGAELAAALSDVVGTDRPTTVGNDADLGALAEHTRGAAVGYDNVIYLHGDIGIGGGIIAGGSLLTGAGGYSGEVGHMAVRRDGRLCGCGSRGCWETEIGEYALLEAAGREGVGREAVDAVVDAAGRGDAVSQEALRQVGDWLGFGIANLVNIFNPEIVILGGMLRGVYLGAAAQVRSRMRTMTLGAHRDEVKLRTPVLEGDAPLIGAAELAFAHLLADPLDVSAV